MKRQGSRLKPTTRFRIYRGKLPHWEMPGSVYFITFHTYQELTLSDAAKDIVFAGIMLHADRLYKLYACAVMGAHAHVILQPLSTSVSVPGNMEEKASPPFLPTNATLLKSREDTLACISLARITHSIKSYSSKRIQRLQATKKAVWLDESYDRIIRDENEYREKVGFIINNPVEAGLVENPKDYQWLWFEGNK